MHSVPTMTMAISGYFRCILRESDETIVYDTGWFPNLITNGGLVMTRDAGPGRSYCALGSDNTAPTNTDTDVGVSLGARKGATDITPGYEVGPPDYLYKRYTYRFDVGENTGNVRELACHPHLTIQDCFNHSLVIDGGGSPTTIVKGADQILDVYHELRNYPPLIDATGTLDISGVSYDYTVRPSRANDINHWESDKREILSGVATDHRASPNVMVARTAAAWPTDSSTLSGVSGCTYTVTGTGNYYNDVQLQVGIDGWVFGGGIRTVIFDTGNCHWQVEYAQTTGGATIPKTDEDRLRLNYRLAFARWVP